MKHFIPFGPMAPDQPDLDSQALDRIDNMLPILGSLRPVKELVEVSNKKYADPPPILGGEAILVTQPEPNYRVEPDSDETISAPKYIINYPDPLYDAEKNAHYQQLKGESPDDGTGFTLNVWEPDATQNSRFVQVGMEYPGRVPKSEVGFLVKYRYQWTMSQALQDSGLSYLTADFRVRFYEGTTHRFSFSHTDSAIIPGEIIERQETITNAQYLSVTDWTDIQIRIELQVVTLLDTGQLYWQRILPSGDSVVAGWKDELGGTTDLYQKVSDLSGGLPVDSTYAASPVLSQAGEHGSITFALDRAAEDPRTQGAMPIKVRAAIPGPLGTDTFKMRVELLAGKRRPKDNYTDLSDPNDLIVISSVEHTVTPSPVFSDWLLDPQVSETHNIEAYQDLYIRITPIRETTNTVFDYVMHVSHVQLDMSNQITMSVSWLNIEWPVDANFVPGDRVRVIVGTEGELLEAGSEGWVDRTRLSGAYGEIGLNTNPSKGWDFTTWGDAMIATNYADVPQIMRMGTDTEFEDIVDLSVGTGDPEAIAPQGRFCEVVGQQLNFYDINPDSPNCLNIGTPYTAWWSEVGNPHEYKIFNITDLSTWQNLTNTDGQIMGAVGGETGVVFKRNSIYRQSFLGYPRVFGFDILSTQEGTPYPKSPVAYKNNVFFWGNGMIGMVENNSVVRRISTRLLEKFIFDTEFEEYAVRQRISTDERENDNVVVGTYDSNAGLVWWAYALKSDVGPYQKSAILILNPREQRFSIITGVGIGSAAESLGLNIIVGRKNSMGSAYSYAKGIYAFKQQNYFESDANRLSMHRFIGVDTYEARVQTKTYSAASFGADPGTNITLNYVRPIFKGTPDSVVPNITITIQAGETPWMQGKNEPSQEVELASATADGWIPLRPLSGGFFEFGVAIPPIMGGSMKELMGLQFDWQMGGDF